MDKKEKMKVLWFANTPCGATERLTGKPVTGGGWLFALSEQLAVIPEIELHIAFYWGGAVPSFEYKGITYHPVLQEGEGTRFGRLINRYVIANSNKIDKRSLPRLLKVVETVKPDIIHIHGSENNFGMIASCQIECPIVLSIQGLLSPCYCKYYSGFSKHEISSYEGLKEKILMSGISLKEKSFKRRGAMEREFFKNIHNIIGRTFWDRACSLALNPHRKYYEVGEIMRPFFFENHWEKNVFSNPFIITTTISYGYYKGLETIYQTAKVLKSADFNFCWNVIGISDGDILAYFSEKKVGDAAKKLSINLLGRKNAKEMVALMKDADLFVQVSHIENSPNSLGEAMLLGMPIIATFAGGTASMLENNVEGRLVQDGDPYALAGMIMEMAADFEQARYFGQKAAKRAIDRHNPMYVCQQLMNVYNEIAK